jgi:hypothetical protein
MPHYLCVGFYRVDLGIVISNYPNYSRTYIVVLVTYAQTWGNRTGFPCQLHLLSDFKQWKGFRNRENAFGSTAMEKMAQGKLSAVFSVVYGLMRQKQVSFACVTFS